MEDIEQLLYGDEEIEIMMSFIEALDEDEDLIFLESEYTYQG